MRAPFLRGHAKEEPGPIFHIMVFGAKGCAPPLSATVRALLVPKHVKEIQPNAFYNARIHCIAFLTGSELVTIGTKAFASSFIGSLTIPGDVTKLDRMCCHLGHFGHFAFTQTTKPQITCGSFYPQAFMRSNVRHLCIPANVVRIGKSCFEECRSLLTVTFEDNSRLEEIGERAFAHSTLESIILPKRLKRILSQGLMCFSLRDVKVDPENNFFTVCDGFLMNKQRTSIISNLTWKIATIPEYIEILSTSCFEMWRPLVNVFVSEPSRLRRIERNAFAKTTLYNLSIPLSVSEIDARAFAFSEIEKFDLDPRNPNFVFEGGLLFNHDKTVLVRYIQGESVEIPSTVRVIGKYSFFGTTKSISVTYPRDSKVEIIETGAFQMSSCTKIRIGKTTHTIEKDAFPGSLSVPIEIENGNPVYRVVMRELVDIHGNVLTRLLL